MTTLRKHVSAWTVTNLNVVCVHFFVCLWTVGFPFVCFHWPRLWFQHPCVSSSSTRNLHWSSNHSIPDCSVVDLAPRWNAQCLLFTHVDPLLVFPSVVCCTPDMPPPSSSTTATILPSLKFLWPVIPAHSISEFFSFAFTTINQPSAFCHMPHQCLPLLILFSLTICMFSLPLKKIINSV